MSQEFEGTYPPNLSCEIPRNKSNPENSIFKLHEGSRRFARRKSLFRRATTIWLVEVEASQVNLDIKTCFVVISGKIQHLYCDFERFQHWDEDRGNVDRFSTQPTKPLRISRGTWKEGTVDESDCDTLSLIFSETVDVMHRNQND
jgi:hypothetical protein